MFNHTVHPLFATYKPDPFDCTAHCSPTPSRRLSTNTFVQLSLSKDRLIESIGAFTPSGSENLDVFSLNVVYVFESPNCV